jgi:hypothetical protein
MSGSVEIRIQRVLDAAGVTGFVHAHGIDDDREIALEADAPVVMASVFKIAVCLELYRQAATDVIIARVGLERINATLRELGLKRTVVAGDCTDIGQAIMDAVGASRPRRPATAGGPGGAPAPAGLPGPRPRGGDADHPARVDRAAGHGLTR